MLRAPCQKRRLELIDALLAALDQSGSPLDDAWMAEVRRRSVAFDAGAISPIPWTKVKERVRRGKRPWG
jgi:putative addiction module component (TIGR02574 family)